ncbi:hypothetical protein N24_0753 [Corynebacterium suranareeae]|uniref:DUF4352 domain-containing protein n=1 Tax=Corynebacterium suranareeae TaxID=2506452 RepID=A0A160PNX6_9CORY|nr:hypothetical protein [Corynebacterium suranareeae]BAU95015.1 hypothetical protein N24_0753 [Corynebacterium suranareeae]
MFKHSRTFATALIALGLGLSACSSTVDTDVPETTVSSATPETTSSLPQMNSAVSADGVTITINSAFTTNSVEMESLDRPSGDIQPEMSREDGIFVVIETTLKNESGADMDITCAHTGSTVHAEISTNQEAVYQPIRDLFLIPGNPECNHNLGSGFDAPMTWVFQIPKDATAEQFGFTHSELGEGKLTWIELNDLNNSEPTSGTTTPQEEAPIDPSTPQQAPVQETAISQNTIDTAIAPAPAAPAYGASCPASMLQQPSQAADGSTLVCIYAGTPNPIWVYGPEPLGIGTASPGGVCEGYEAGGQDASGNMMMCSGGQWVYGP